MKLTVLAGSAFVAFALNGCIAAGDGGTDSVGRSSQAVTVGGPGGDQPGDTVPAVSGTPLYSLFLSATKELDVQTCNVLHPGMLDPDNPADSIVVVRPWLKKRSD